MSYATEHVDQFEGDEPTSRELLIGDITEMVDHWYENTGRSTSDLVDGLVRRFDVYQAMDDRLRNAINAMKSINNRLVFAFPLVNPEQDIDDPIEAYRIVYSRVSGAIEELNKALADAADMVGAV